MPRRNNRADHTGVPPLDLTPPPTRPAMPKPGVSGPSRAEREAANAVRQRKARINGGIDWNICLVPGCGEELKFYGSHKFRDPERRDPERVLPMCFDHQMIVWTNVQAMQNDPIILEANARVVERLREKEAAEHEARKKRWAERRDGHIYFVRLNGLVKAGWSRDVHERLRAYGPLADVLCIYPGTRDDETHLHRQLRPVLARGREWYEDCKIIEDFVADAVKKHGPPVTYDEWTKPKQVIKPRKRTA
jgi:hypothetical protein